VSGSSLSRGVVGGLGGIYFLEKPCRPHLLISVCSGLRWTLLSPLRDYLFSPKGQPFASQTSLIVGLKERQQLPHAGEALG
jgi:hypothetical protein